MSNASEHKAVYGNSGKKGAKGKQGEPPKYDYHYVRYTPSVQDQQRLKGINPGYNKSDLYLNERIADGYKRSLSFDRTNGCYVASLTCNDEKDPNYRSILTGRGGDAETATIWLAYLDDVVFERVWVQDTMTNWSLE